MSQMVTRKSTVGEEKEKRQTDSPVKDMKKKMAANAEKEKQATEKTADKPAEKPAEKAAEKPKSTEKPADKPKPTEKPKTAEKPAEKAVDKPADKKVEKNGTSAEKKVESKAAEKKDSQTEKKDEKGDKSVKTDKPKDKPKQNGSKHNGVSVTETEQNGNGADDANGTVSDEDDVMLVIDDQHEDEMFPELAYEDSDEGFEPPTPDGNSRSFTRRSQSKVLKLKEDAPASTDRKLRSADSPKPESKKDKESAKEPETPKKGEEDTQKNIENGGEGNREVEIEIVDVDLDDETEPRKTDTNYSKSRVKVSPYRRSGRLADQTASSVLANYTGNNTTMEMDITGTSLDATLDASDSSYLSGLRGIRGRRSYKQLKELTLRERKAYTSTLTVSDQAGRPMGTVVGRKRKPEPEPPTGASGAGGAPDTDGKRVRLLERIAHPFRALASTPLPARRNAEIVGINTDLPLSAPVAALPTAPLPAPLKPEAGDKRCIVM